MLKTVSSITNAIGALNYKGTWNATTNTPTITSSVGVKGDYYQVSVAGSTAINGISNWGVGDVIAFNGVVWQRIEGGADLNGVNLSVSGTTNLSGLTASTALALDASKDVVSVTNTGTGNNVLADNPTLTTPTLGAASATSINKVALTAPATGSTLTIADGKTLTANHSLTLAGTDATTMTFPTTNATIARTDAAQTFTGTQSFATVQATTSFQETNGTSGNIANGATFTITVPTPRRPQFLTLYAPYNLNQGWFGLIKGDGSGSIQVNAIVDTGGMTVAGTAGNQVTVTNNFGGTTNIRFALLPLGVGV